MAEFYGADVEQLRLLGRELAQQAESIEAIGTRLSARVTSAAWNGPDANRFRGAWTEQLLPTLRRAQSVLVAASDAATTNARQQEEVSGASGGAFIAVPAPGVAIGEPVAGGENTPQPVPAFNDFVWEEIERIKRLRVGEQVSIGDLASYVPGVSTAFDVLDVGRAIHDGDHPINHIADFVGGALRGTKNPVAYLGGVAIGVGNAAAVEAEKADFSAETWNRNMKFISEHGDEAAEAAGKAIVDFLPTLIKQFK